MNEAQNDPAGPQKLTPRARGGSDKQALRPKAPYWSRDDGLALDAFFSGLFRT